MVYPDLDFAPGAMPPAEGMPGVPLDMYSIKYKYITVPVEAGESLGFLPGDYQEKVGPYLRPLYDALYEMMPAEKIRKRLEMGVIEVAPLAYMRGRTLNNSFVILDEAQNIKNPETRQSRAACRTGS